jgi:2-polyprenyl-3-methyl-5-hydroxy-6-metoxy-1,4-benzoquinol methylase
MEPRERDRRTTRSDDARIGVFLFAPPGTAGLGGFAGRIPTAVRARVSELVWVDEADAASGDALDEDGVRILRTPGPRSYGGARKAAFDYAIQRGLDLVIAMRADGVHPVEALELLIDAAAAAPDRVTIAARYLSGIPERDGPTLLRRAGHHLSNRMVNSLLRLDLRDYLSGLRAYPTAALASVPFHLDSDGRDLDMEILIQLRALGVEFEEIPAPSAWQEFASDLPGMVGILRSSRSALQYRLHQLHVTRDGRYLVDHGVHYALKSSLRGSHFQIVDTIDPGADVLDLGCSQGLLAKPLSEKGVELTGVDQGPAGPVSPYVKAYYQHDLDRELDLPLGRDFDYVVIADVIEHLQSRHEVLVAARRFLREGGRLVVSTPNIALWFYRLSLLVGRFEYGARGVLDRTHVHLYTRATFRREVERAGFRILRERVTSLPFEVVFESTGRNAWIRRIETFYHALARLWPEMFAYQFILEAEITTLDEQSSVDATSHSASGR